MPMLEMAFVVVVEAGIAVVGGKVVKNMESCKSFS